MRIEIIQRIASISLLCSVACFGCSAQKSEDSIVAVDFSGGNVFMTTDIKSGQRLLIQGKAVNKRDGNVSIEVLSKSCGCLDVGFPKNILEPGETVDLTVSLPSAVGRWSQSFDIEVSSANGERVRQFVPVRYSLLPSIETTPSQLVCELDGLNRKSIKILVNTYVDRVNVRSSLGLDNFKCEQLPEAFTVDGVRKIAKEKVSDRIDKMVYEIVVTPMPDVNESAGVIKLTADGSTASLKYRLMKRENVVVSPSKLLFGEVALGSSASRNFMIRFRDGAPVAISNINCGNALFTAKTQSRGDGPSTIIINVTFTPLKPGVEHAKLTIMTDNEEHPVINVEAVGIGSDS